AGSTVTCAVPSGRSPYCTRSPVSSVTVWVTPAGTGAACAARPLAGDGPNEVSTHTAAVVTASRGRHRAGDGRVRIGLSFLRYAGKPRAAPVVSGGARPGVVELVDRPRQIGCIDDNGGRRKAGEDNGVAGTRR